MLAGLADAIDELDVACDLGELAEGLALADRLMAKLTDAVGRCDDAGLWALDGSLSMAAWLRHHGRMSSRTAAGLAARGRKLRRLPVTSQAWASGSLSGDQVQAMVVNLPARTLDAFTPGEADIVASLAPLSVADTVHVVRAWSTAHAQPGAHREVDRCLYLSETLDGRAELTGHLDPEGAAIVNGALRSATAPDPDTVRSAGQYRADALVDVCRWYLDHHHQPPATRHRPHLNVVVDYDDLLTNPGATLHVTRPDGTTTTSRPPP